MSPFDITDIVFTLNKCTNPFKEIQTVTAVGILRQNTDHRTQTRFGFFRLATADIRQIIIDLILKHVTMILSGSEFPFHVIKDDKDILIVFNERYIYNSAISKS